MTANEEPSSADAPHAGAAADGARPFDRRRFLGAVGGALAAAGLPACNGEEEVRPSGPRVSRGEPRWEEIRDRFALDPAWIHMAGLLIGPRGTGIAWGRPETQGAVSPTIPTFSRQPGWGPLLSPGGFKSFEHQWAMAEAFGFHEDIGKAAVAERIHALSRRAREELAVMDHVHLHTPLDDALAAGIVCFEIDGREPAGVVAGLRDRGVIASTTPYSPSDARITPGLLNTAAEVEHTLGAIQELT